MTYEFACGDVVDGCPHTFHAPDHAGILEQVAVHAQTDHGMTDVPDELVMAVRAAIHPVG